MTIATTASSIEYVGNGVTTVFSIPFYFLLASDLTITITTGSTTVTLSGAGDYTVTGAGLLTGGTATLAVAPASLALVTITRVVPVTQLTDYVQDDAFPAESHEKALDKLTMICQQLQSNIDNAVLAAGAGGEVNTGGNLGGGIGVYRQKAGVQLQFRTISSPGNGTVDINVVSNRIEIDTRAVLGLANSWTAVGQQSLAYNIPITSGGYWQGWEVLMTNPVGSTSTDLIINYTGHSYHNAHFNNNVGAIWNFVGEVWSNPLGAVTMVGSELGCISQMPGNGYPTVAQNLVFKNRSDVASHPLAPVASGPFYNDNSYALYISSQARPSGAGAAWSNVGSGWNIAIKVGDFSYGSGLDWEGGNSGLIGNVNYTGNGVSTAFATGFVFPSNASLIVTLNSVLQVQGVDYTVSGASNAAGGAVTMIVPPAGGTTLNIKIRTKAYSTVLDVTDAGSDLAGGNPWVTLWRTGNTYFGLRFINEITTGEIQVLKGTPTNGGAGYAVGNAGTINNGTGGTYNVVAQSGGVVTQVSLTAPGTLYFTNANNGTTATSGGGTGLVVNILQVRGERLEFWRCTDPGDPLGTGSRYGFIDLAYNPIDADGPFLKGHV
jgi:hypothetical protein